MISHRQSWFSFAAALAAGLLFAHGTYAEAKVGHPAPQFSLTDVATGEDVSLSDYKGKVVIVTWQSINCPWDKMRPGGGYQRILTPLAQEWKDNNVVFLAINSNRNESVEEVASYVNEHNMPYPILKDPGNVIADAYGAKTTPHFFVVNSDDAQTLVYKGGFEKAPTSPEQCGHVDEAYLAPVVTAVLAGEEPPYTETASKGCSVKRVKK